MQSNVQKPDALQALVFRLVNLHDLPPLALQVFLSLDSRYNVFDSREPQHTVDLGQQPQVALQACACIMLLFA